MAKKKTEDVAQGATEVTEYPSWVTSEQLNENDHEVLKQLFHLLFEEKFDEARELVSGFDTLVRIEIPHFVLGRLDLLPSDQSDEKVVISDEPKEQPKPVVLKATEISFPNALILRNDILSPITQQQVLELLEKKFYSKHELEQLVFINSKAFFGEQTLIFQNNKEVSSLSPDCCLFDLSEIERPRLYLIVFALATEDFGTMYARITHFIASLKGNQSELLNTLCDIIEADYERNYELQSLTNDRELLDFLWDTIDNKPEILLIVDGKNNDVTLMQSTYTDWGKLVKPVVIKKYNNDDFTMYTISPIVTAISTVEKKKKKADVVMFTEEDHLQTVSETVREVYFGIKTALLNVDESIAFNPKKYYISLRKNKNIAFFQFRKKVLSIVVCNPEEETRTLIAHHEIKSLVPSVQKFWNSKCCTIAIDGLENLEEVIGLLQMMIVKS
jgi:predicted transport protein